MVFQCQVVLVFLLINFHFRQIVPIDECFVDFIESLGMHSKVIPTFKLLLFNTKSASINSDVIELPLSLTLRFGF